MLYNIKICFKWLAACSKRHASPANLQSRVYKINKIYIFFKKYLTISKKSSTFAPDLINKCLTIKI